MGAMSGAQRRAIRAARKREAMRLSEGNVKLSCHARCGGVYWDITVGPKGGVPREFRNAKGIGGVAYCDMVSQRARKAGTDAYTFSRWSRTIEEYEVNRRAVKANF